MKLLPLLAAALFALPLSLHAAEPAAEEAAEPPTLDLEGMTCRDLLQSGGSERDLMLAMHHGYQAGKAGIGKPDLAKLAEATDKVIDYCIDHPSETVNAAFTKANTAE